MKCLKYLWISDDEEITIVTVQIGEQQTTCIINVLGEENKDMLRDTMNQIIKINNIRKVIYSKRDR